MKARTLDQYLKVPDLAWLRPFLMTTIDI